MAPGGRRFRAPTKPGVRSETRTFLVGADGARSSAETSGRRAWAPARGRPVGGVGRDRAGPGKSMGRVTGDTSGQGSRTASLFDLGRRRAGRGHGPDVRGLTPYIEPAGPRSRS